jgi:AraC-like DNA-binding protein
MFVSVKFKEENKTVVNIDLLDHFTQTPILTDRKFELVDYSLFEGKYFMYYSDGFCLLRCNYSLAKKCTDMIVVEGNYIHISLLASGSFKVLEKGFDKQRSIKKGTLQFAYLSGHDVEMEMSAVDENLNYTRIFLSEKFYLGLLENELWVKQDFFYTEVKSNRYVCFGQVKVPMNYEIIKLLNEIAQNVYEGSIGHHYLLLKLKELFLMSHIFRLQKPLSVDIKAEEIEKLELAKVYLEKHYKEATTIKLLSRIVLLNEFKLKNGFKQLYNCTIHSYIIQLRMEQARKLLIEETAVNEVSFELGYKSVSHFIAAFRKYFGVTPKQVSMVNLFEEKKYK